MEKKLPLKINKLIKKAINVFSVQREEKKNVSMIYS